MIRIIAGERRGAHLATLEGETTRPLRDRIRESLFNILGRRLREARVLDVFAGSGAVGLEALSRGASHMVAVESDGEACRVIERNVRKLRYEDRVTLVQGLVPQVFRTKDFPCGPYNLVFLMPPYHTTLGEEALAELPPLLAPGAVVVLEVHLEQNVNAPPGWDLVDDRAYGITRLLFLTRTPAE